MAFLCCALLLIAVSGLRSSEGAEGVLFKKERVAVTIIACDTIEIEGTYIFENRDTVTCTVPMYYPFPVDSVHCYPHKIILRKNNRRSDTGYTVLKKGIRWRMSIGAGRTDSIVVIYRQKTNSPQGSYILTTTRFWDTPIETADFSITLSTRMVLTYWSFTNDTLYHSNNRLVYGARRVTFFPQKDMEFRWQCAE